MRSLFDEMPEYNSDPREGEYLRDQALDRLRKWRPSLIRRLMRAFLEHLVAHGPATSDAVRAIVPIPHGTDPRVVGSAVRALAESGLIESVGSRKSRRCIAHARRLELWSIPDEAAARRWLACHPDVGPPDESAGHGAALVAPPSFGGGSAAVAI